MREFQCEACGERIEDGEHYMQELHSFHPLASDEPAPFPGAPREMFSHRTIRHVPLCVPCVEYVGRGDWGITP